MRSSILSGQDWGFSYGQRLRWTRAAARRTTRPSCLSEGKMSTDHATEEFRIYIVRLRDHADWVAKVNAGDEIAQLCLWAASKWRLAIATEHSPCQCCDRPLSIADKPQAFIVFVPTAPDPEKVEASAGGVCSECSEHDDRWIVDQGVHRTGMSLAGVRPGDRIN